MKDLTLDLERERLENLRLRLTAARGGLERARFETDTCVREALAAPRRYREARAGSLSRAIDVQVTHLLGVHDLERQVEAQTVVVLKASPPAELR